jgi:CheY-like chemotaxis protein
MSSHTLLLVEDNEDDVFAFKRALKKSGIAPALQVATDGQKAIDYLAAAAEGTERNDYPFPALVFLDLKLPYHDGLEVLAWIRAHPRLTSLPVVILSGSDEPRDHARADELAARGYLVKPATSEDIRRMIDTITGADSRVEPQ